MNAFRKQIEVAGKKERSYVLDQIPKLQKNINRIIDSMTEKIAEGEYEEKDLKALELVLERAQTLTEFNSRLLGYEGENDEAELNLRIKGKKQNWNHFLPDVKGEVQDVDFTEEK